MAPADIAPPAGPEAATFGAQGPPEPPAHGTGWWVGVSVAAVLALGLASWRGYLWGSNSSDQSDLEAQLAQANDKVASLQQQVDDLTAQQKDLQDRIDQLVNENQDLTGQVQALTQARDDLTQQLDDAQSQLQDVQGQLDTANAQLQALLGASPGDGPASVGGTLLIHGQGTRPSTPRSSWSPTRPPGRPPPGNRLVAVALQLANVGSGTVDGSFGDGVTLTADGTAYSPVGGGPDPDLRNVSLEPGASTGGYLTFEVPESASCRPWRSPSTGIRSRDRDLELGIAMARPTQVIREVLTWQAFGEGARELSRMVAQTATAGHHPGDRPGGPAASAGRSAYALG